MAPRGGGPGGPRLLSTLSSPAFDGLFSIWTGPHHEKDSWSESQASLHVTYHQSGQLKAQLTVSITHLWAHSYMHKLKQYFVLLTKQIMM